MNASELKTVLEQHALWLVGQGGVQANLRGADLRGANLRDANLSGANLRGADLRDAKHAALACAQTEILPSEGEVIGWKRAGECLVKVRVPPTAARSNASGRKCRAEHVDVLEIVGTGPAISNHDGKTEYKVGATVRCHEWCPDRWIECAGGIHFFLTKEEAEDYR